MGWIFDQRKATRSLLHPFIWVLLLVTVLAQGLAPCAAAQTFLLHDKGLDRYEHREDSSVLYRLRLESNDVVVTGRYRTRYGESGRKTREGDGRTPEGRYEIEDVRQRSRWDYRSFGPWSLRLSYPNQYDRRRRRTGSDILLHGGHDSVTNGCIRILDDGYRTFGERNIAELAHTVPEGTPIISAGHVPRFLKGPGGRRLGAEAAAFYRDLLRRDQDNDTVLSSVATFNPIRYPPQAARYAPPSPPPRPAPPPVARKAPPPRVVEVSASGYLRQTYGPDCRPQHLNDGDSETAWCEAAQGDGLGQWVEFRLDRPAGIRGFSIVNGYDKKGGFDRWPANGRVQEFRVAVDDRKFRAKLKDSRSSQDFTFKEPPRGTRVRITIKSVYPGNRHSDTCLSEVHIDAVE